MKPKVILIQINLSPYRIPLFERLGRRDDIDFTLALMAKDKPSYPTWKYNFDNLPFRTALIRGICIKLPSLSQVCLNPALLGFLNTERPNVVICCGFTASTILSLFYGLLRRTPVVIWMEGNEITESQRQFARFRRILRRYLARRAAGFISAGQRSEDYLQSLLPVGHSKPIRTSYNAVDTEKLSSLSENFRSDPVEWKLFRDRYPERNLLFSGRLVEIKGIDQLLCVYEKVLRCVEGRLGLIILGEGPLSKQIEEAIRNKGLRDIYLEGFVDQDVYPRYFALADVFVLLSLLDCNPLVIFEALSCGLPVVSSDRVGNAPDFIADGINGYMVDPYDIEGVAEHIINILKNPNLEDMKEASKSIVRKANYDDSAAAFVEMVKVVQAG